MDHVSSLCFDNNCPTFGKFLKLGTHDFFFFFFFFSFLSTVIQGLPSKQWRLAMKHFTLMTKDFLLGLLSTPYDTGEIYPSLFFDAPTE